MTHNLESNYDCAQAGSDLHELKLQLNSLRDNPVSSKQTQDLIHRLENQIHFIKNKCDIHP